MNNRYRKELENMTLQEKKLELDRLYRLIELSSGIIQQWAIEKVEIYENNLNEENDNG